jgi:hypothetical protein
MFMWIQKAETAVVVVEDASVILKTAALAVDATGAEEALVVTESADLVASDETATETVVLAVVTESAVSEERHTLRQSATGHLHTRSLARRMNSRSQTPRKTPIIYRHFPVLTSAKPYRYAEVC